MPNKARYLVCINEKEHSKTALFYACTKAKQSNSHVDMLYVIDPVNCDATFSVADVIKQERHDAANKLFKDLQKKAQEWYGIKPNGIIREGIISQEIISQITDNDKIVMMILGVAEDGSSDNSLISQLSGEIGKEFLIPIMLVPGNLTKEQIISLNKAKHDIESQYTGPSNI